MPGTFVIFPAAISKIAIGREISLRNSNIVFYKNTTTSVYRLIINPTSGVFITPRPEALARIENAITNINFEGIRFSNQNQSGGAIASHITSLLVSDTDGLLNNLTIKNSSFVRNPALITVNRPVSRLNVSGRSYFSDVNFDCSDSPSSVSCIVLTCTVSDTVCDNSYLEADNVTMRLNTLSG